MDLSKAIGNILRFKNHVNILQNTIKVGLMAFVMGWKA